MSAMQSSTRLVFTLTALQNGWSQIHLESAGVQFDTRISYTPNDGLAEFLHGLIDVLSYAGSQAYCTWSQEPGFQNVTLSHLSDQRLRIQIQDIGDERTLLPLVNQPNWTMVCDMWKFARKARSAYKRLLDPVNKSSYAERWHHSFPTNDYQALCRLIATRD